MDVIRRRKEQLKKEIQVHFIRFPYFFLFLKFFQEIREKIAQCEIEMSMIQSHSNDEYVEKLLSLNKSIFFYSRRHSNVKQWSIGKKRFNDNPKEVKKKNRK